MSSFELNKFLGALLGTCLILVAVNIASGALFAPEKPAKPGYDIAVQEPTGGGEKGGPAEKEESIEALLAKADPKRGEATAKVCQSCHTFNKGGPNSVGPNLWGVVGRPRGSHPGFDYSEAMKAKKGDWTVDDLNQFLTKPQAFVPGTKMGFTGFSRANQRADVIAYLNTLADNPKPLPTSAPQAAGGSK